MKILIAALVLVLLVAGCVGQGETQQPTGGASTSALDGSLQGITADINAMNTDSSDLSPPSVDLSLP
ncbi:MAG: hypothetical protein V1887_03075 [Candidatus Aenigmatarchaeota archaeon]